jgi:hypothetical protein
MKKLISLLIGVLLLTSIVAFMPMPAKAMFLPEMFVSPGAPFFYTPCVVSTEFDISVKIWNQIEETGYGVYAFEFWLYWPNSTAFIGGPQADLAQPLVDFVNLEVKPPWPEGQYFIIKEELNLTAPVQKTFDIYDPNYGDTHNLVNVWCNWYHFAITALDKAPPLTDVKIPVVDFTFHIADEPLYGVGGLDHWIIPFHLDGVQMTDFDAYGRPIYIYPKTEDGCVCLMPRAPQMWLNGEKGYDTDKDGDVDFDYVVKWTNCTWFTIEIEGRRFGGMYGFELHLTFNATLLNTDLQHIHIKDFVPPPYDLLTQEVYVPSDPWSDLAYVHINLTRPCNKPPICGAGPLVNIDFHTKCPTLRPDPFDPKKPGVYTLPTIVASSITLTGARVYSKYYHPTCTTWVPVTYGFGTLHGDPGLDIIVVGKKQLGSYYGPVTNYNFVNYHFIPLKADVDQNGHVDLIDLSAVAKQYGKGPSDNEYAAAFAKLETTSVSAVDLLDVVYVAKYFCKDFKTVLKWPIDPYTGTVYDP